MTTIIIIITATSRNASEDPSSQFLSSTEHRVDFISHLTSSSLVSFCCSSVVIFNLLHKEEVEVQSSKLIGFSGLFSVFFVRPYLDSIKRILSHHVAIFEMVNFLSPSFHTLAGCCVIIWTSPGSDLKWHCLLKTNHLGLCGQKPLVYLPLVLLVEGGFSPVQGKEGHLIGL